MTYFRTKRHHVAGLFAARVRMRFKSTPSVPTPASPTAVSGAQTASNVDTAVANATLGNVNQQGPLGSTTYNQTGSTDVDGNIIPSYTQTTNLNPTLQSILAGTENTGASLVPTGQTLANQAATSLTTPLNFSGANQNIIAGGPQAEYAPVENQVFQGEEALLKPGQQLAQTQLQDQLSQAGIPVGSQAYNSATINLNANQAATNIGVAGNAAGIGATTAGNMFNLALLGQNQQNQQQVLGQQNPLQNLSQIYGSGAVAA